MNRVSHTIYISIMVLIGILATLYCSYTGYTYYNLPLEERFYHPNHDWFRPSGVLGHGLGILGTLMILFGVTLYIARKRYNFLSKYIKLKYLLEFHIFLCSLGPIFILFHTAFKFGGVVSVAFWSMVIVVLSGVIGRFIYIQIPRTIEGRELTLGEVNNLKADLSGVLENNYQLKAATIEQAISLTNLQSTTNTKITIGQLRKRLKTEGLPRAARSSILKMIKQERSLSRKIARLQYMQRLFKYWHVAHLPFALIMLVIVVIHVVITLAFGYKWIL